MSTEAKVIPFPVRRTRPVVEGINFMRGFLIAIAICIPFWIGVGLLVWWLT